MQLAQRIRLRFHLTALTAEDTAGYITHRLEVAGAEGRQIFTPGAMQLVFRYSGGVPRLINTLCDTAMMSAFALDKDHVDETEVQAAVEELQWIEYAARTNRMARAEMVVPVLRHVPHDAVLGRLIVETEGRPVDERELKPGRIIVGRTTENDIQIDSKYVSRHHCQITVALEAVVIEDLNSTNGIVLKGKRVRRHVLKDGDVIVIGQHELRYVDARPARSRPAEAEAPDSSPTGSQEALTASASLERPGSGPH